MEFFRLKTEVNPEEVYRRLIKDMSVEELERELNDLQEARNKLGHSDRITGSVTFIDLEKEAAFVQGVDNDVKLSEVEGKIKMVQQAIEEKGELESA